MNAAPNNSPVVLLLGEHADGNAGVEKWLADSRYRAWEAEDVFQVLEQVSDFTVRNRPEVVLLHVGETDGERDLTRNLLRAGTADGGVPVIDMLAVASGETADELSIRILDLACQLDQFIPHYDAASH